MNKLLPLLKAVAALLLFAAFFPISPVSAKAWVGGVSNNWDDPGNWDGGTVPTASDEVNFFISSTSITININSGIAAVAKSFDVVLFNSSTLNLNVNSGGSLVLDGGGTVAHGFSIRVFTGSNANITVNGDLTVEDFATRNIYLFNSSDAAIFFTNSGTVTIHDCGTYGMHIDVTGGASPGASNTFTNTGTLDISDGAQYAIYTSGRSSRPSNFINEGDFIVEDMDYICFVNTEGTYTQSAAGSTEGNGIIKQIGTVTMAGEFETFGTDTEGISLEIGGASTNFDLSTSTLHLAVEGLAGKGVDDGNDHVNIIGDATLAGSIVNISFEGGFIPSSGHSFQFITVSGTTTGSPTFNLPPPPPGLSYTMSSSSGVHTLTVGTSPFPVEFLSIDAEQKGNAALISWQTASESNNEGFVVQRSHDGLVWEALDFVPGNGTSQTVSSYEYLDYAATEGRNQYRLQQWDLDGQVNYSDAVELTIVSSLQGALNVYPIPATSHLITEGVAGTARLLNGLGQVIAEEATDGSPHRFEVSGLPNGLYYLQVETSEQGIVHARWLKK